MSPTRPEREQDCSQAPGEPARPLAARETAVTGAAAVAARIELHLAQCRRRRGTLALLCVSVETMTCAGEAASANLERRVRDEVSHRIGNGVRGSDFILRESDRDTCVVLADADCMTARRVIARLERLLNGDYRVAGELLQVRVRIGAAAFPQLGMRAQDLLRHAGER